MPNISLVIIEREKFKIYFLRGVEIMFDNNC